LACKSASSLICHNVSVVFFVFAIFSSEVNSCCTELADFLRKCRHGSRGLEGSRMVPPFRPTSREGQGIITTMRRRDVGAGMSSSFLHPIPIKPHLSPLDTPLSFISLPQSSQAKLLAELLRPLCPFRTKFFHRFKVLLSNASVSWPWGPSKKLPHQCFYNAFIRPALSYVAPR